MSEFEPIEDARAGCGKAVLKALVALGVVLLLFSLAGCRQVQTVVEVREKYVHDTTEVHDSVFVWQDREVHRQGDTVFATLTKVEYKYKYLDRVHEAQVHDSVPYPVEVTKYVRQRNGYDRFTAAGFWVFVALIAIALAVWIAKKIYLKR